MIYTDECDFKRVIVSVIQTNFLEANRLGIESRSHSVLNMKI